VSAAPSAAALDGRRERSKRERVERILEATRALLREQPERSPSVERIAERAAVAPATVFNLVGPRERIWAALGDELLAELERRSERLQHPSAHEQARQIAAVTIEIVCADAAVYRAMMSHWSSSGRLMRRSPTAAFADCLRRGVEQGRVRADLDDAALAETITTGLIGAAHQWAARAIDDEGLARRARAAVDVAFAAAAPPAGDPDPARAFRP
jgi:AcrR family transcriptional regulator